MRRVLANVLAAASVSVVFLAVSTVAVYAEPNFNNPGHHYGWYRHHSTPAPAPGPQPNPAPAPNPGTGSRSGVGTQLQAATQSSAAPQVVPVIELPIGALFPTATAPNEINSALAVSPSDPWWWLLLVLPPTLLAIWLIAARRLGLASAAARKQQTATQPV